jgi:16S rRNA C967 or C1407 C5-methylase (RsmB/RsmF family)
MIFYNRPIAWYPQPQIAWQLDCGRTALSKTAPKYPDIKKFHTCLLEQTEMGTIDRQESVSMIPVLLLDVQPQHRVLDMCASPGSKTTQVIDFLLTNQNVSANQQGMVIANDLNKKRAYMLVHRLTRNTLRKAVVTCGSGDQFPGLYDQDKVLQKTNVFDRVLCDVPCSGDGTLRKNQGLWREWHIGQGITLHPIQLSIVLRGAALLKVGGLMVYSTCSFNPVENEAVVAELLRRSDGALEVMRADYVQKKLPGLIARPGRTKWKVGWRSKSRSSAKGHIFHNLEDKNKENGQELLHDWYEEYDQVPGELVGTRLIRSMFSPTNSVSISKSLENTMRLIPIDQNSGGFYIAVLRKVKNLPSQKQQKEDNQSGLPPQEEALQIPSSDYICKICEKKGHFMKYCDKYVPEEEFMGKLTTKPCEQEEDDDKQKIKRRKLQERREHLFRPLSQEIWASLENFYGIQRQDLMVSATLNRVRRTVLTILTITLCVESSMVSFGRCTKYSLCGHEHCKYLSCW